MKRQLTLLPLGFAPVPIVLDVDAHGAFELDAGEKALAGSWEPLGPHEALLRIGDRVVPFYTATVGRELHLWLAGDVYRFALDAAEDGVRAAAGASGGSGGTVTAPMPGRVVQVPVQVGRQVEAGDLLAVVESMKVQFNVAAPAAGTVVEVRCEPGQMVDLGAVLMKLEPNP
jgi:acetyl/propionyl-CoA carboxylase alpha subunit